MYTIEELLNNDFTSKQIKEMNSTETLIALWKNDGVAVVDECMTYATTHEPMEMKEFLSHCTACGGNWGGMFLSGIKALAPEIYDAIPDNMTDYSFLCLCEVLALMKVYNEGNKDTILQ